MKQNFENDYQLLKKVAQKDFEAFEILVHNYKRMVINVCFRLTGDRQNAEDLAQEVFFEVFRKAKTFRGDSKFSSWLYRIAVNRALNHNRKHKLAEQKKSSCDSSQILKNAPASRLCSPEKILENKENKMLIKNALDSLPEKQRTAFILHHQEGLSYQEIAEILQSSRSSVESRIHRARLSLKDTLLALIEKNK